MYYVLFSTIATILALYLWTSSYKRKFSSMENIPGPKPLPFLGNVLDFGFNPVEKLKNIHRLYGTYGPMVKVWLGPKKLYLVTTDPEFSEKILSSPKYIKKAADYTMFKPWLGNGLLVSAGSYWLKRRKIITPTFHFKILDDFIGTFNKESIKLVENLSKNVGKTEFDVYPYVTACTLDVICETAMGTSVKAQDNFSNNEYVNAVKTECNVLVDRVFSSWKQFDALFPFSNDYKKQTEALKIIHGFTNSVIEKRRQQLFNQKSTSANEDNSQENVDESGMKRKMAFLDLLLQARIDGQPLSDKDIREEVDTFMFEGHDTTASLIAFVMYELAKHPDKQDKLFSELRELFQNDKNHQPSMQNLNDMKYMELVIKEALRLYPSVPYFARTLEEDVDFNNTTFPKDLTVVLFAYGMQRRPDLYPEPDEFIPERFLSTNTKNNPFAYVPFSAGPRNCIGQKFAMYEAKSTLSRIIMNFELVPADSDYDLVLSGEVILKPANGVYLQLKPRKYQ